MTIKGQLEIPNEEGTGFDVVHNETSADVVLFSDTTVADVLQAHKSAIDGMSSTYAKKSDVESAMRFYIGTTQPTDTTVIWLEPI